MLLILKLTLVPALVVSVSVAARRWGPVVGGLLTSFPIVTGPALFFFAVEQGDAFAAEAARAVLVALVGVAVSGLVYAWASLGTPWWISLSACWSSFVATTLALQRTHWHVLAALAVALVSFVLAHMLLPPSGAHAAPVRLQWDLPLRAISSMIVVVSVTALAAHLGPAL